MDFVDTTQVLGNLGEFFGAIAVVVTLAYLAVQMRQNTKALKVSAYQEFVSRQVQISDMSTRHADVLARVHEEPKVSAEDYFVIVNWLSAIVRNGDAAFYQYQEGLLEKGRMDSSIQIVVDSISGNRLSRTIWKDVEARYDEGYRLEINERIERKDSNG